MANNNVNNNSIKTLKATLVRKEFWVGLATTVIVLLVAFKLFPWDSIPKFTTNKTTNVLSPVPTNTNATEEGMITSTGATTVWTGTPESSSSAMMATGSAMLKRKVMTLADTAGGSYTVITGDNYYSISLKVCGTGKFFESIQEENNGVALYAGDEVMVNCTF